NIPADHLSTEGLGSSKPVADNTSAEGRKKNRRIEFTVL
ncbi:OmpA family protein, partial [Acinetobacter baumannii]|nr:OmpA family protein [Acinetobacter baumannii]